MPFLGWLVLIAGCVGFEIIGISALALVCVVLAAVHHAEVAAHRVGEPVGTLILAVAVTVIEVGLIVALMLADPVTTTTVARDTVLAASMIILNLLLGPCLLVGARHDGTARFTRTVATATLAALATLLVLTLVLPNYTTSTPGPVYTPSQLGLVATFSLILYIIFVFVQTVKNRDYFLPTDTDGTDPTSHATPPTTARAWSSFALLVVGLVAVVLLAKSLSNPLEDAVTAAGAPIAVVGIAIAAIVLLPEGIAAVRAAYGTRLQTSLNLTLGSAMATIGLTIPAVAIVSFALGLPLTLGLDEKGTLLLMMSLFVAALSLARGRTTLLHGAVHLTNFAAYLVLTVIP
jgi:Ca2+:H+ antiporter